MEVVKISESNYQEVLENYSPEDYSTLSDCIGFLPQKNEIISQFIVDLSRKKDCKEEIKSIIENHLESNKVEVLISTVIYAKRLGVDLRFDEIKIQPLKDTLFEGLSLQMNEVSKIKVLEYLERIRAFVKEVEGIHLGDGELFEYFFCVAIVKNFRFSVQECLKQFNSEDQVILTTLAFLSDNEDPMYLLSLFLKIESPERVLQLLDKRFRDLVMALEPSLRKEEFVDEETEEVIARLSKVDLPPLKTIRKEDFIISKDKEKFFNDFCLLGSPSVSHFLSYLEIYKKHFILKEEEQKLFVEIFKRIFVDRKGFSRIILSKMVLFKILKEEFI